MARISLKQGGRTVNGKEQVYDKKTKRYVDAGSSGGFRPPAARGDDFAENFNTAGGADIIKRTGGSIGGAIDVIGGRRSSHSLAAEAKKTQSKIRKSISKRNKKGDITGKSATDLTRASELNTAEGEATTTAGRKSTRGATEDEITQYERFGYREGDMVPGRGRLLPDGTFDDSAFEEVASIEEQANALRDQVNQFATRESTEAGNATSSDTPIVNEEKNALDTLASDLSPSRAALDLLLTQEATLQQQLEQEIKAINLASKQEKRDTKDEQKGEVGTTSVGIANAGGYLGFSGSGTGVMLSLTKSHRAELQAIEGKRQQAIAKARQAAAERKFDVVRDQAKELARLDQETYEREEKYNDEIKKVADKQKEESEKVQTQKDIFGAIEGGAKSPSEIFKKLNGAVDMETISSFLEDMTPSSSGSFKYSSSETAKLLGAGLSQDDISVLHEFVNENGYTEDVRASLTPAARKAADDIYRTKTGTGETGKGVAFTLPNGKTITERTMQVLDGFTTLDALTPTSRAEVKDELYDLGFNSDKAPEWFNEDFAEEMLGLPLTQETLESYYQLNIEPSKVADTLPKLVKNLRNDMWSEMRSNIYRKDEDSGTNPADNLDFDSM